MTRIFTECERGRERERGERERERDKERETERDRERQREMSGMIEEKMFMVGYSFINITRAHFSKRF